VTRQDFTPPKYAETQHFVFDSKSGEIVATETRWSIVRGKEVVQSNVGAELLDSLASQTGKEKSELDVLVVNRPRRGVAARVDVRTRKLVMKRDPGERPGAGAPSRSHSP